MENSGYYKGLVFSMNEEIKISDLKKGDYSLDYDFTKLEKWMSQNSVNFIVDGYEGFHYKFSYIKSKPFVVYYQGDLNLLNRKVVGVVGPRDPSSYGEEVLEDFLKNLARYNDIATVSGLAEGIDTMVFRKSVELGIPTIAVLGGGLAYFLKSAKRHKLRDVVDNGGLVLSEFKLKQQPARYTFPQRNRIIAGLSNFLFLPEAGEGSGALITVDFANEMNVPVYGPGNSIFESGSRGVNKYISSGKINMVYDNQIFLREVLGEPREDEQTEEFVPEIQIDDQEKEVFDLVNSSGPLSMEEISHNLGKDISSVMHIISMLEIKGLIYEKTPGKYLSKN